MTVVRTTDAIVHELQGTTFTSYAAPAQGSRELCAWRVEVPAGSTGLPHRVTRDEVFLILDGQFEAHLDGEATRVEPGDVLVVEAGREFRLDNPGDKPATAWVTTSVGLQAQLADGSWLSPPWVR